MDFSPDISIADWPEAFRATTESQFHLLPNGLYATSPFTGQQIAFEPQAQRFVARLTFPAREPEEWRALDGFIARLRGRAGFLRLEDYHRMRPWYDEERKPAGGWNRTGNPDGVLPPHVAVAEDAFRDDTALVLAGFAPAFVSTAAVLRAGDLFELRPAGQKAAHGHLYLCTDTSNTDAGGETLVQFQPPLRANVVAGDQAVLRHPTSVFKLASDEEGVMNRIAPGNRAAFGLSAIEVLP